MHIRPLRLSAHALVGGGLAVVMGALALVGFFALFGSPTSVARAVHVFPATLQFLVTAGLLSGLAFGFRADSPDPLPRLRTLPTLACASGLLALIMFCGIRAGQSLHFYVKVLRPTFTPAASEQQVRARLGSPDTALTLGSMPSLLAEPPCDPAAVRALWYSNEHGHAYRVLYFDSHGRYLCDFAGDIW